MPSGRRPQQSPRSQLESSATRPYLTLRSKLHAGSCIRESSTLLGEQTTAPMRLCIAKQRFPFSPLDLWTPYAKESLGCLWLPGPCCFAGGLLSWKPTPNMLSFMAKQEFAEKCLLVAGPSKYQYPSKELRTEAPSHPLLKILFRELHSGKVDSPQGTNHSPNAPLLSKATLAFFTPSPLDSIGQRGSGLPLAPWALLLCWWSPEVESHSKRVPLREYTGVGKKMNSGRWPQQTSGASLGTQHRTHIKPMTQNSIEAASFWKGRLSSGNKPQPQCAFAQQSNACLFLP